MESKKNGLLIHSRMKENRKFKTESKSRKKSNNRQAIIYQ